ncbi:MAG: DUF2269 family protein [Thermoleophilia bacterium]|nr:DUF2269 family protein [Thermoleophilia bacterium]
MSAERIGLLVHLLGAFAFIAGVVVAGVAYETARRRRAAIEVAAVLRMARVGAMIAAVGGVVLLVAGFWLAGHLEMFRTRWLELSILAFFLSFGFGAAGGRRPRRARELAVRIAAGEGGDPAELRQLLDDRLSRLVNWIAGLLALLVIVLMVVQPAF